MIIPTVPVIVMMTLTSLSLSAFQRGKNKIISTVLVQRRERGSRKTTTIEGQMTTIAIPNPELASRIYRSMPPLGNCCMSIRLPLHDIHPIPGSYEYAIQVQFSKHWLLHASSDLTDDRSAKSGTLTICSSRNLSPLLSTVMFFTSGPFTL